MKHPHITKLIVLSATVFVVTLVGAAQQAPDRFSLKTANGIAFSEFRDYEAWQMIATSQPDDAGGCGTSKVGCTKAILGNATMIKAYRDGFPANGTAVPDGAAMAKIEWLKARNDGAPYGVTVSGAQTEVSFMLKDSKRFPDTNGWGYATFEYRRRISGIQASQANHCVQRTQLVPRVPRRRCQGARLRIHRLRKTVARWSSRRRPGALHTGPIRAKRGP